MDKKRHIILGIHITGRVQRVPRVQDLFTEYGCSIKTRLGLHEASESVCSPNGLILLENGRGRGAHLRAGPKTRVGRRDRGSEDGLRAQLSHRRAFSCTTAGGRFVMSPHDLVGFFLDRHRFCSIMKRRKDGMVYLEDRASYDQRGSTPPMRKGGNTQCAEPF